MKRGVAILMMGLLLPVAAFAQEWQAYSYPEPGFAIQFPAAPTLEKGTVKTATGFSLPVMRYTVRQERIIYNVSVVDYSSVNADALSTIAETERSLGKTGKVAAATGAHVNRSFGRDLSLVNADGSRSAIAIFFVDKHLYTVVGHALPPNAIEMSEDAIRFQESLQFIGDNGGFGGGFGSVFGGVFSSHGEGHARGGLNPRAQGACTGKSAGDAVQLETPSGPVAATCMLVARPNNAPPPP